MGNQLANTMEKIPLYKAAKEGDLEEVQKLLASCIKPDAERDEADWTPLMAAAYNGHTDCVIELIKAKADVNHENQADWTPLMATAYHGHTDCVIELLRAKADVNHKESDGEDAASYAAMMNFDDTVSVLEQARDDFEEFLKAHMTDEEKSNACRREYGRAFALASRVTKSSHSENIAMSEVHERLPSGYRDMIRFFSRNPGLVKWTGTSLLLYFNAGPQSSSPSGAEGTSSSHGDDR